MDTSNIVLNQSFTATFAILDSASGNTVTYKVIATSDGSTFASGSATWVGEGLWKVTFTPTTDGETYIVVLENTTLEVTRTGAYRASQAPQVTTVEISDTTNAAMLTGVKNAIMSILNGGAVTNYTIGGRTITHQDLPNLYKLKTSLEAAVQSGRGSNDQTTYAQFGGL